MTLNVLDVIELWGKRVVDIDDNDFPVSLLLVEQGHDTKHLDLFHLAAVSDQLSDFADVEGVVVALSFGFRVDNVGVFPRLAKGKSLFNDCH